MKVSTLISVALAATAQLTTAAPYPAPAPDPELDNAVEGIEVRGVGELHHNFLKKRALAKRAIDWTRQKTDTENGWVGGIRIGNVGAKMVNRREIRDFYNLQGGRVYDLYVLALRRTQDRAGRDKNSWWQLAGVHGRPYQAWNNRGPGSPGIKDGLLLPQYTGTGYCTHGSTLFPTWHRPYLAYFEEVLWASAYLEINKVTDAREKALWEDALEEFRIPYWDWGIKNAELPSMLRRQDHVWRFFPGVKDIKDAPPYGNPLYTFFFKAGTYEVGNNFGNDRFRRWRRTLRHPKDESPGAGDNIGAVNTELTRNGNNVRQQVRELLLRSGNAARWGAFSNRVGNSGTSVESIHDNIHVWVGGALGHMSSVPYSSFDPIFFLHHTNVDRLFAIWQAINPDLYVTPQPNGGGTYGIPPGRQDNATVPLEPWIKWGGGQYNSNSVRETSTFGYDYPEIGKHKYNLNTSAGKAKMVSDVRQAVEALYPNSVSPSANRKRDYGSDPVQEEVDKGIDKSVSRNKYYEWRVEIIADRTALSGSYTVHFFLGKPNRDHTKWYTQPEFVGDYAVFTHGMDPPPYIDPSTINNNITGSVPLTDAMVNAFGSTNLTSLNPQDAIPFLIRHLRWRVSDSSGNPVRVRNVRGLNVAVSISLTTLPTDEVPYTQYGDWTFLTEIVRKIGRDGGPDKVGVPDLSSTSSVVSTAPPTETTEAPAYVQPTELPVASTTEAPAPVDDDAEATTSTYAEAPSSTDEAPSSTVAESEPTSTDDVSE